MQGQAYQDPNMMQPGYGNQPGNDAMYAQQGQPMMMQQQQQGMMMQPQMGAQPMTMQPGMQQQPGMQPGMGMQQPMMMNPAMMQQQQMMMGMGMMPQMGNQVDPIKFQDGMSKLAVMNQAYIKDVAHGGCSDMVCMQLIARKQNVSCEPLGTYPDLVVELANPTCGMSSMIGDVKAYQYQGDISQTPNVQTIFGAEHNRTCCALKCMVSWLHIFGMCNYYLCTLICPPHSKITKEGATLYKYKYGCCGASATVNDGSGQLKYKIERGGAERVVVDANGTQVPGVRIQVNIVGYGKHARKVGTTVTFNSNMTPEEKMAVIYACCRMN